MRIASRCTCVLQACVLMAFIHTAAFAGQFHDQAPMTNAEVELFIKDFPVFKQWMFENKASAKPIVGAAGEPSFQWDATVASWFADKAWTPERFFM